MTKKNIDINQYAGEITKALGTGGIYLTTKAGEKVNSMVIGWGHMGRLWNRPVFTAYVRTSRYSLELLDQNPEFTINVPTKGQNTKALKICGSLSGRDMDKISEAGLTLVPAEVVSVPAILEFPLTLECRVLYRQQQDATALPPEIRQQFYEADTAEHVVFNAEIVAAYLIEE